ncbi:MAG: type II secretion system F family protein [Candidatus Levybacteria bacterium]|nr:type II secretion system F family protein [Candidatus Levybacteria bacterium]
MQFSYRATTKDGKLVQGTVDAKDPSDAAVTLRQREFFPIRITPKENTILIKLFPFLAKTSENDSILFTRQLASMLTSGLTLMQALAILKNQVQNEKMQQVINNIIVDIEGGKTFSSAIGRYPDTFPVIYISLIKAGEVSGLLDKILLRLAENMEKQQKLKNSIKSALMYPAIIMIGMTLVLTMMMIFVIPQLAALYENLNLSLPFTTQVVIGISNFVLIFWPFVIGGIFLSIFLFRRWYKTDPGRLITDSIMIKIPVFGKLNQNVILTEFSRTLGLLIGSGALVVDAFKQTADVTGNALYRNAILAISQRIQKGISIGDALGAYTLFPSILVQMVKIGEQTGKLDESLTRVSEYFEREVDQTTKTLTTALEPISIITPIYNLISQIQ